LLGAAALRQERLVRDGENAKDEDNKKRE